MRIFVPRLMDIDWSKAGFWLLFRQLVAECMNSGVLISFATSGTRGAGPQAAGVFVAILMLIWVTGSISGAQINPTVTMALTITRRQCLVSAVLIGMAQIIGAMIGTLTTRIYQPARTEENPCSFVPNPGLDVPNETIFLAEAVSGFLLVIVVLQSIDEARPPEWNIKNNSLGGSMAIASVHAFNTFVVGPISGNGMNSARALGPAIVNWCWHRQWIYIAAPLVGGLVAAFLQEVVLSHTASLARTKSWLFAKEHKRIPYTRDATDV